MSTSSEFQSHTNPVADIQWILEWLATSACPPTAGFTEQLQANLFRLSEASIPCSQRLQLLDLLYRQAERVVRLETPALRVGSLPVSGRRRQRITMLGDILATLAREYHDALVECSDQRAASAVRSLPALLRRAMQTVTWQIQTANLVAAAPPPGVWQKLHSGFRRARQLAFEDTPGPRGLPGIRRLYANTLLAAIAQPGTFSATELEFIFDYIDRCVPDIEFHDQPPPGVASVFWIDTDKDAPAYALIRRTPNPQGAIIYFSGDAAASRALRDRDELLRGSTAGQTDLPSFGDSRAVSGILWRLNRLWGYPDKRRFLRRRQPHRAKLCTGLANLWDLLKASGRPTPLSEWMVTNESPDGYALMHVSGPTRHLRIGDLVALRRTEIPADDPTAWQICVARWAISENSEHLEMGLQVLANHAIPVELTDKSNTHSRKIAALILPPAPPLNPEPAMIVPAGELSQGDGPVTFFLGSDSGHLVEPHPTRLVDQTACIEIFTLPNEQLR